MRKLSERFVGKDRIIQNRISGQRRTGKTVFTNRAPFTLIQRLTLVVFSLEFICLGWWVLDKEVGWGHSLLAEVFRAVISLMILIWIVIGVFALFALPPFQSRKPQ